ncbi:tumor necrosis factor alpha-induced protein 8-like protein 2 [Alligator sinensis]|uniref:Tumor necrosis factor alpha-induced protein 8-like protein 2 n=1 Tax=Alligator sinensis TaxID=38654 RepID=A0A1U7SLQ6_ALLSI|nr:tumor necrosis factor alpha-induced protein 8-like protein 2 [Alligator sinensis]
MGPWGPGVSASAWGQWAGVTRAQHWLGLAVWGNRGTEHRGQHWGCSGGRWGARAPGVFPQPQGGLTVEDKGLASRTPGFFPWLCPSPFPVPQFPPGRAGISEPHPGPDRQMHRQSHPLRSGGGGSPWRLSQPCTSFSTQCLHRGPSKALVQEPCEPGRRGAVLLPRPPGAAAMEFSARSLVLQAEKKVLSRMAGKATATLLLDEVSGEVLDELYRVSKQHTRDRAVAQRVIKDLVKVAVKVAVLFRNGCFGPTELDLAEDFRRKLRQGALTAVSFQEVEFTFEAGVLAGLLAESRDLLLRLVDKHLTPKSHGRIRHVFDHFGDAALLSQLYSPGPYRPHLDRLCRGLNQMLEDGRL